MSVEIDMDLKTKTSAKTGAKIKKLAEITQALYQGKDFNITRLTTLKSLCETHDIAIKFVYHLAKLTEKRMVEKAPKYLEPKRWSQHKELTKKAIFQMNNYLKSNNESNIKSLKITLDQLKQLQNKYENQRWGPVRIIESSDTLLIEKAIECILAPENYGFWAYHVGREYAEKYDARYGTGLIPDSAPLMEDIVNFWIQYYRLDNIVIRKKST